ncbi:MAG: hypothetical protein JNK72_24825 [Myxococcales bacterium]|nr:hypothetical protein [Myxococcales bacterium]
MSFSLTRKGSQSTAEPFSIAAGQRVDLVKIDNACSDGIVLSMTLNGYREPSATPLGGGARIDWSLYASEGDADDDDPVYEGSTYLADATAARSGMLMRVTGKRASVWYLRAQLVPANTGPTTGWSATGRIAHTLLDGDYPTLEREAGPVIG